MNGTYYYITFHVVRSGEMGKNDAGLCVFIVVYVFGCSDCSIRGCYRRVFLLALLQELLSLLLPPQSEIEVLQGLRH